VHNIFFKGMPFKL